MGAFYILFFGYKKMECLGSACTLGGSSHLLVRQMLSFAIMGCAFCGFGCF